MSGYHRLVLSLRALITHENSSQKDEWSIERVNDKLVDKKIFEGMTRKPICFLDISISSSIATCIEVKIQW